MQRQWKEAMKKTNRKRSQVGNLATGDSSSCARPSATWPDDPMKQCWRRSGRNLLVIVSFVVTDAFISCNPVEFQCDLATWPWLVIQSIGSVASSRHWNPTAGLRQAPRWRNLPSSWIKSTRWKQRGNPTAAILKHVLFNGSIHHVLAVCSQLAKNKNKKKKKKKRKEKERRQANGRWFTTVVGSFPSSFDLNHSAQITI